jgi:hypothetical protein
MRTAKLILAVVTVAGVLAIAIAAGAAIGNGSGSAAAGAAGSVPPASTADHHDGAVGSEPCGEIVEGKGPDGSVGYIACDDPLIQPRPQVVEPTPGMADVQARPFDSATVQNDGRTIAVDFVSGIEPCSVLDHVQVMERDHAVRITLFEGYDPGAGDVACIDIGVLKRVMVTLDEAIDDRVVVDGAAP